MISVRQLADGRQADPEVKTARNLPDAANSNESLEGYAAINHSDDNSEIEQVAYRLFQERGAHHGHADEDWFRAEQEVRRKRESASR